MSTRAEIGLSPIACSRDWSQAGEGPFVTPRITRPAKSGQPFAFSAGSIVTLIGQGKLPATGAITCGLQPPEARAARSRAMPRTPSASGRFGVTLM